MSPDEVLEKLWERHQIKLSRSSLVRYENQGFIPAPERGGGGPGGRYTNFPPEVVEQVAETYMLLGIMTVPQLRFLKRQPTKMQELLIDFCTAGGKL